MKFSFQLGIVTRVLVWCVLGLLSVSLTHASQITQVTHITVTPEVLRSKAELEPLGMNYFGDPGGMKASNGDLILQGGFEPAHMRDLYRVIEAGKDQGYYWITLDGAGTSIWLRYNTGTYSGARMRAYRFLDRNARALPYRKAKKLQGGKILDTRNVAQVRLLFDGQVLAKNTPDFPKGGWLAETGVTTWDQWKTKPKQEKEDLKKGWRVYYDADVALLMDDVVIFEREILWPDLEDFHPRKHADGVVTQWKNVTGQGRIVAAPAGMPEGVDFGKGVYQVTPVNGVAELWYKLFYGTDRKSSWYGTLEAGLTYRYEAWVKVEGIKSGSIHLGFGKKKPGGWKNGFFGKKLGRDFPVNDQWQRIGFEFTAPETSANRNIEGAILRYVGHGQLLVDNVKLQPVYQAGDANKPFVIYQKLFETMMENQPATGKKGALRSWAGLNSASMDDLLRWSTPSQLGFRNARVQVQSIRGAPVFPRALTILEATGNNADSRMTPWLIAQVTHRPEEYWQLIEYLAAPYDPVKDTPQTKPFAHRRTLHRGHNRPWTDDFREIILEFGNENWHNRKKGPWIGVGRAFRVHQGGPEMGAFTRYLVEEIRKSPYWNPAKIKINVGGNYKAAVTTDGKVIGFGQEAVQAAGGTADYHSHATYIGPRWETGESSLNHIDDAGLQKTLFAYRPVKAKEWQKQAEAHEQLKKLGFNVRMTAYEGGPSGFVLRPETPEVGHAQEYYGKSYAMATAMLDAWLDAWAKGWTYQCYLAFGQGIKWNSHTSMSNGHRPSPAFLIQTLINQTIANRDMFTTTITDAPTLPFIEVPRKWDKKASPINHNVSTIQAHSFGGNKEVVVAISNLNLNSAQVVEITLPITQVRSITQHSLKGNPRDTNLEARRVELVAKELPATQLKDAVFRATVPAGSPVIFVFNN